MNLPNKLTVLRVIMVRFLCFLCLLMREALQISGSRWHSL